MIKHLLPLLLCAGLAAATISSFCPAEGIRRFSLPRLTTRFVQCTDGIPTLNECEPGTVFDSRLELCAVPVVETAAAATDDSSGRIVECPDDYDPERATYIRHPTLCDVYFICVGGIAHQQNCPPGTYFNSELKVCDLPEKVDCAIHN
ncbi:peritrophin-1-like [Topomyia yanbarensis]|uniref:peritrophin-1-like n=1 Tax=Topomyia yanbarensis TaxID=2498891 RepID=UPI00273AD284|nr:peritrophin-1-like [Topomyia yanbarensis]